MVKAAKESNQVERARKKIKEKISHEKGKLTPNALQEAIKNIHTWIERHRIERIPLSKKKISHNADVKSKYVLHLMQSLQGKSLQGKVEPKKLHSRLKGRVKISSALPAI